MHNAVNGTDKRWIMKYMNWQMKYVYVILRPWLIVKQLLQQDILTTSKNALPLPFSKVYNFDQKYVP